MRGGDAQGGISAVFMYEKHPAPLLDKAGLHGYNIKEGRCYSSQTLIVSKFI